MSSEDGTRGADGRDVPKEREQGSLRMREEVFRVGGASHREGGGGGVHHAWAWGGVRLTVFFPLRAKYSRTRDGTADGRDPSADPALQRRSSAHHLGSEADPAASPHSTFAD